MTKLKIVAFMQEESGVALSEYLVLLGLLTGGVAGAVVAFGTNLTEAYTSWSEWVTTTRSVVPD